MAGNAWLLTWTSYGTWLPGDERGFVGYISEEKPADLRQRLDGEISRADNTSRRVIHNIPGTPYDRDMPGLKRYASEQMKGDPVWLTLTQAESFLHEAQRTAGFHQWQLLATAVMANHVHLVVIVPDDLPGERLLQEFKSYGSRVLNKQFGKPQSGTWWTKSGSTRLLPTDHAVHAAVEYVRNQHRPLVVWIAGEDVSTGVAGSGQNPSTGIDGSQAFCEPTTPVVGSNPSNTPGRKKKDGGE